MAERGKISARERYRLKQFIKEIASHRGRGTELVTVYVPAGYDMAKIIQHLSQEQGTATNIKSSSTRKNVIDALERMIQHLRLYERTPKHGLAAFSGNVAEREGQQDLEVWSIEPPVPLNQRLYRCDKEFITEPLEEIADDENTFGLVVLDKREGSVALLKGKTIIPLAHTTSAVPGKTKAGGQCLAPDTLVQMADGGLKELQDVRVGDSVLSSGFDGQLRQSEVLDKWTVIKAPVYVITTKHPRMTIVSSKDHLFLQSKQGLVWSAAENLSVDDELVFPEHMACEQAWYLLEDKTRTFIDLSEHERSTLRQARERLVLSQSALGERIGVAQSIISRIERGMLHVKADQLARINNILATDISGTRRAKAMLPYLLDARFAQLIGYIAGDGYRDQSRIGLCEEHREVAEQYARLVQECFGVQPSVRFRADKNYFSVRACLGDACESFFSTFPEIKGARDTLIPSAVLGSPNEVLAGFLRGIFDAEGYVSQGKVGLSVNNKQFATQLQLALRRFGIIASLRFYDNKKNPYSNQFCYTIYFSEKRSMQIFEDAIGFTAQHKREALRTAVGSKSRRSLVRQILASGSQVRSLIEDAGMKVSHFKSDNPFFRNERRKSKDSFRSGIMQEAGACLQQEFLSILDHNLLPTRIASIRVVNQPAKFVDISVEAENFIANGLVVHNSAQRFERLRDGAAKDFYRKMADYVQKEFLHNKDLKGILIGGPGKSKEEFLEQGQLTQELKDKVIGMLDLSYTGEFGLQELLEKSQDILSEEDVVEEKQVMQRFFLELSKSTGKASYGQEQVMKLISMGAVDTLLLSEALDEKVISQMEKAAEDMGTETVIVSLETREGAQLKEMGKVAAILRYAAEF